MNRERRYLRVSRSCLRTGSLDVACSVVWCLPTLWIVESTIMRQDSIASAMWIMCLAQLCIAENGTLLLILRMFLALAYSRINYIVS